MMGPRRSWCRDAVAFHPQGSQLSLGKGSEAVITRQWPALWCFQKSCTVCGDAARVTKGEPSKEGRCGRRVRCWFAKRVGIYTWYFQLRTMSFVKLRLFLTRMTMTSCTCGEGQSARRCDPILRRTIPPTPHCSAAHRHHTAPNLIQSNLIPNHTPPLNQHSSHHCSPASPARMPA